MYKCIWTTHLRACRSLVDYENYDICFLCPLAPTETTVQLLDSTVDPESVQSLLPHCGGKRRSSRQRHLHLCE